MIPVSALVGVLLFRVLFRRPWLAYLVLIAVMTALASASADTPAQVGVQVGVVLLILVLLTRLGLFAFLVGILFSEWNQITITFNPASWFFPQSVVTMVIFAAVAIFGFWVSLGDQKLFKDSILER